MVDLSDKDAAKIHNKTSLKKITIQRELEKKLSKMQLYITIIKCKMP